MTFAEKLVFLMQLTSTSNKQLALAVKVDPSLISLLRSARREAPKNPDYMRAMSAYFAKKCGVGYQRIALSEVMGREQIPAETSPASLADMLFLWLTESHDRIGPLLNTLERSPVSEPDADALPPAHAALKPAAPVSRLFYGNEGKRAAVAAFAEYLLSLDTPGDILLASDENPEWLTEAPAYLKKLQAQAMLLFQRGFRLLRIAMPIYTTEQAFDSLSQLMPIYLTGQADSFYYPHLRDNVHRRTLLILKDAAAVVSNSVGDRSVSRACEFTQDTEYVRALAEEFQDYLGRCRPMMTTYSTRENADALLRCISQFENDEGDRIQQSTTLSSITSPLSLLRLATASAPEKEAEKIVVSLTAAQERFYKSLGGYRIIDIHSLADVRDVRAGVVPVAASYLLQTPRICYTPETYALHLQSILTCMERFDRYTAVLRPCDAQTHALMVKDGRQALLLRPGTPLTVFEVSQPYIAEACRAHLLRLTEPQLSAAGQRRNTMLQLQETIRQLRQS